MESLISHIEEQIQRPEAVIELMTQDEGMSEDKMEAGIQMEGV